MRIAFFSAALIASGAIFGATAIDGWYASAFGGYTYLPDNIRIANGGFLYSKSSYDDGFNAGGRFGFQSNPMRYEAEYTYIEGSLKHFQINNLNASGRSGNTSASAGMANVYYDFREMVQAVRPFLGVGIGVAYVESTLHSRAPFANTYFRGSDTAFAFQATAGLTFNFAENYALNIAYRYLATSDIDPLGKMFQANLATAGVIYRFNEMDYK